MAYKRSYPVVIRNLPEDQFREKKDLFLFVGKCLKSAKYTDSHTDSELADGGAESSLRDRVKGLHYPVPCTLIQQSKKPTWKDAATNIVDTDAHIQRVALCDAVIDFVHKDDADVFGKICELNHKLHVEMLCSVFNKLEAELYPEYGKQLAHSPDLRDVIEQISGVTVAPTFTSVKLHGEDWQIDIAKRYIHNVMNTDNSDSVLTSTSAQTNTKAEALQNKEEIGANCDATFSDILSITYRDWMYIKSKERNFMKSIKSILHEKCVCIEENFEDEEVWIRGKIKLNVSEIKHFIEHSYGGIHFHQKDKDLNGTNNTSSEFPVITQKHDAYDDARRATLKKQHTTEITPQLSMLPSADQISNQAEAINSNTLTHQKQVIVKTGYNLPKSDNFPFQHTVLIQSNIYKFLNQFCGVQLDNIKESCSITAFVNDDQAEMTNIFFRAGDVETGKDCVSVFVKLCANIVMKEFVIPDKHGRLAFEEVLQQSIRCTAIITKSGLEVTFLNSDSEKLYEIYSSSKEISSSWYHNEQQDMVTPSNMFVEPVPQFDNSSCDKPNVDVERQKCYRKKKGNPRTSTNHSSRPNGAERVHYIKPQTPGSGYVQTSQHNGEPLDTSPVGSSVDPARVNRSAQGADVRPKNSYAFITAGAHHNSQSYTMHTAHQDPHGHCDNAADKDEQQVHSREYRRLNKDSSKSSDDQKSKPDDQKSKPEGAGKKDKVKQQISEGGYRQTGQTSSASHRANSKLQVDDESRVIHSSDYRRQNQNRDPSMSDGRSTRPKGAKNADQDKPQIPDSGYGQSRQTSSASHRANSKNREDEHDEVDADCAICLCAITQPKELQKCKHKFCKYCIDKCFKKVGPKCPVCGMFYGQMTGTQPKGGTMRSRTSKMYLPGYGNYKTIEIAYRIPSGKQESIHPNPGRIYTGVDRIAYLPDNPEGREILKLLERAFAARLVFTVGKSSTTGLDDCVTWNDIHHKTSTTGGPASVGYPDPTYLKRVRDELAAKGIK